MKVLFVSSGNFEKFEIAPFIKSQGESLKEVGIDVCYYPIKGKGLWGYLKHVIPLKKEIKVNDYDLIHAHYSLCGIVSLLTSSKPIVISLMGSDIYGSRLWIKVIKLFFKIFGVKLIVKSEDMKAKLSLNQAKIIPNGINLDIFKELDRDTCRKSLGLNLEKKYLLFLTIGDRNVKNFDLMNTAYNLIKNDNIELIKLSDIPHNQVPLYINAANVLVLTSHWEGSPNVVKEAMACNCPIVSTDVGDIRWLFGELEGHFIARNDQNDFADKLKIAIDYKKKTTGRNRIIELELDSHSTAKKLIKVYNQAVCNKMNVIDTNVL